MRNVNLFSVAATAPPKWPKKLTTAACTRPLIAGLAFLLLLFAAPNFVNAQNNSWCQTQNTSPWPGTGTSPATFTPTIGGVNSAGRGPGQFFNIQVYNGLTYQFRSCPVATGGTSWDTDINVFNNSATIQWSEDGTSANSCGFRSDYLKSFTSNFTGTARVIVTRYGSACSGSYGWSSGIGSHVVTVRETAVPTPPVPSTNAAACGTVTLTRANPPTGYTYYWQTTASGTSTANSATTYAVNSTTTIYLRAQSASGNWGTASSRAVTFNAIPAATSVAITAGSSGQCGGSITLTASGGGGGTMYWQGTTNNGTSTATATTTQAVTSSGTYYFRSRSTAGCWGAQGSIAVTINTVPAAVSVANGGTQCGGSRTLTASGGGGGTIYWQNTTSNGTSTATASTSQSVSATGTYYFRSRSTAGCWGAQGSAAVTINPIPGSITVAGGGTFCSDQLPVTITASGGSGGTIYFQGTDPSGTSTTSGGASQSISSTGTYFFRSRSTAGCWGPAGNTTVTVNSAPAVVNVSASATTQCGGSVTLTATGGAGGTIYYQGTTSNGFSTSLGSTPQTVSASGTYYFRSYSGNCWGPQGSVTITINAVPAAVSVGGGGTFCTNGTQTLTASGGGGGTIYWQGTTSNGTSTATASSSQAVSSSGTYYFRSRSAQGCWGPQGSAAVTINSVPAAVTVSGGGTGCNGQATLTASGGAGGTIYWQNTTSNGTSTATPSTSQNVTSSGTYYFRSRNASGNCWGPQGSASVTIVAPIVLSTGAGTTQSTCGASNGTACVTASGGTGTYTYAWSGGGSSACKTGVPSGSYQVTVSSGGCSSVTTVNVTDAGSPTASISSQTNVSCFGGNNGSATVTIGGGTGPYNLSWSNGNSATGVGAGSYSTSTGLAQGTISVTVTDANTCNSSASTVITQPTQLTASVGLVTDVLCFGASTGAIDINVSGGTGTKTFVWSPGGFTTEDISGRPANTYSVIVTDGNGCTTTTGATIAQPAAALSASSTFTNVSCFGGNNGAIDLSVSGGTGPYTYVWSNAATTQDLGSLTSGSYTVTITDANGCTLTHTRAISQPASAVSITVNNITNVGCFGASTGSITISGSGGTAGYQYALNAGSFGTSGTFGSLAAGNYTLRVRDANSCETSTPVTVTQPAAALAATILSTTDANCFGSSSGAVDLGVTGGTTNYGYLWSNGATTQDLTNVPAGSYSVTVTDNNSCSTTASASVGQATVLSATASVTDVSACQSFSNGAVTFTGAGGSGSYSFSINNGSTYQLSSTFTGLAAGTYQAWIRDNNVAGCDVQLANVVINQPASLPAPTLPGGNTYNSCGLLVVNVTPQGGADRAVLYDGIPGGGGTVIDTNTAFILNTLSAGNYTFYATSYNSTAQCEGTAYVSFTVAVVNPILITANVTDVSCFGAMDGAVDITVSGGTGSYSYNWSNGATSQDLLNVGGSSYNVVVTDGQGCFNIGSYRVVEFAPINASISVSTLNGYAVRCHGDSSAQMNVNATGGDGNYSYSWSDGSTQAVRADGYQGTFTVTVTDGKGCSITKTTTLLQPPLLGLNLQTSYFCSGGGYSSATIQIIPSGGQAPYEYSKNSLSFRQSSNIFSNLADGSIDTFYVFDANNCVASAFNTVTLPAPGTALNSCDLIYVAPESEGGDVNNAGTPECPTTLAQAMNLVSSTRTNIRMLGGTTQYTYASPVQLVNNVTVEGGFTRDLDGEWIKNTGTPTIINFENAYANPAPGVGHYAGFISTGRANWTIRDMTINVQLSGASGTQDGNGRSVYGILINGSSNNYTLSNVEINTGDASDGGNGTTGDNGQNGQNGADGAPGQFIQDNTNGNGPFPACCGGGTGGTGGDGGGTGGVGSADPGHTAHGNTSACVPYGSPTLLGGGGGGSGGHGGSTNGLTVNAATNGGSGGGGGRNGGPCNHNAAGAAVAINNSPGFVWNFYSQPQPAPAVSGVNGNNGLNGGNATLSFAPGNTPNTATLGQYFIPGMGADGGSGFGGSGGSGGGGTGAVIVDGRSGTPAFLNVVRGSGGGAGGGGAEGGHGGDGGGGGGAAFGLYVASNSVGGASLTSVIVNSVGVAGNGGTGANGGSGGTGGFGGQGGPAMSDTQLNVVLTSPAGNGGIGGNGGNGGRGQDGDNGTAAPIYFGGNTPPAQTPTSNNGTVTVSTVKACTNSVIPITKTSSDNWVITGGSFVNDITNTTSSFNASSDTAHIFYTSVGSKNIGVGSTTYPGFINVTGTRPVPVISSAPFGTICQGGTIDFETTTPGVQFRWSISSIDSPNVVLGVIAGSSVPNLPVQDAGTFIIKLEVREECCGWSIPRYATVTVSPLPVTMPAINGPATVCAGQSVTYSAPTTLYAAPNTNTTTGYKWQLPAGAVVTSAGGLNGFIAGGNINITVTLGSNSGDVTITPSNSCGDGDVTILPVTVAPTPVITGISGNVNICSGDVEVLTPVVTGATGVTYLWSTGATTSSITVSPTVTTTYTVTVTAGSCSDVESKTLNVTTTPAVAGAITGLSSVFYAQPGVSYSIAPVANATSYTWAVPAGANIVSGQGTTNIVVNFGTASSGNVSVTPVNGACSPAATNLFVTVAAPPLLWTGNTSNNWNVGTNWSTGNVPTASDNILIPTGRPNYPEAYTAAPVGNQMVIESGAWVTLQLGFDMALGGNVYVLAGGNLNFVPIAGASATLRVAGNFELNGTLLPATGTILLDGTTAQTISGTGTFHNLEINNNAGVSIISGMVSVRGGLNLDAGVLTTNDRLTIKSDALGTGWVDNFSPGMNGSISGDIIMQRFFPAAAVSTAFHYISSAVNNGAVSQLSELGLYGPDGGQIIPQTTCDPNAINGFSPYGALFEWREDATFLYNCKQSGWFVRSSGNLTNGRGYAGIVPRTADFTIDMKGTANTGTISYNSLGNTNPTGDGWHIVSNPYPSPIEWNAPAGFVGAAHFWQSSGSYTGTYQPRLSGTGYQIPSMQGFLIEVSGTGPANFVLNQSDRRAGDPPTFFRQASWYDHILNVQLSGNNFADITTIYFAADPTDNWDDMYDAQKRLSNANQPTLYTRIANYPDMVGINGLPSNNSSVVSVPMGMKVGTAGTYTFTFEDINTFDASTLIYLEDLKTGTIQNLRANDVYTFTSTLSDDTERFVIHFYPPAAIATVDGNCEGLNGAINVDLGIFNVGGSMLTWDSYELVDANGVVVATNTNVNGNISVTSLPAGNYNLNLSIQGYQTSEVVTIGAPDPVDANYNTGFSTAYTQAILEFLNQSVNATDYTWTFGDGTTSNLENPTHIYNAPGQYDVTLVASSGACSDTYSTKVEVLEVSVGLPSDIENPMVTITSYQDVITIGFLNLKDPAVQIDIFDLTGRKIIETLTLETGQAKHQIKMSYIPSGYYFVRVSGTNTYSDKKVFLSSDN